MGGMPLHSLGQYGAALANAVSRFMRRELAPHCLNNLDFTLIRLFLTDQEWTVSELAEILAMDNPATSRVVSKLVDTIKQYSRRRSIPFAQFIRYNCAV